MLLCQAEIQPVLISHIACAHAAWLLIVTQDARRLGPMHTAPDPRVDVTLYFCNPHRIKEMDVAFMARVSEVVPVIPILAKVGPEHSSC